MTVARLASNSKSASAVPKFLIHEMHYTDITELVKDGNMEDIFEFNRTGQLIPTNSDSALTPTGKKTLRAQFGRKYTHNEQLFVAPCGMIMARETFYHAEAIYSVIVSPSSSEFVFYFLKIQLEWCFLPTGDDQANLPYSWHKARSHFLRQQLHPRKGCQE
jgi:hypothetical protein